MGCALCGAEGQGGLDRVHGLDWCATCRATDPTDALVAAGFAVEWDASLQRFSAGMHIPGVDPEFSLACRPERWTTALAKVWIAEIEVGDPTFDDAVYVRTSSGDQARAILGEQGVQSALLTLLAGTRANDLGGNEVRLEGETLTVGVRPTGGLDEAKVLELEQATAALALHLRR